MIQAGGKVLLNGDMTVTVNGDAEIDGELMALREPMARTQQGLRKLALSSSRGRSARRTGHSSGQP